MLESIWAFKKTVLASPNWTTIPIAFRKHLYDWIRRLGISIVISCCPWLYWLRDDICLENISEIFRHNLSKTPHHHPSSQFCTYPYAHPSMLCWFHGALCYIMLDDMDIPLVITQSNTSYQFDTNFYSLSILTHPFPHYLHPSIDTSPR